MENSETQQQEDVMSQHAGFVLEQMKAGADSWTITQKLVEQGVDQSEASRMVSEIQEEVKRLSEAEQMTPNSLVGGLIGGLAAAILGGLIWGLIVKFTDHEIGYMAWGIGLICGFGVVIFCGRKKGVPLQIIAVLTSVIGILLGKYATFVYAGREYIAAEKGAAAAAKIQFTSPEVFKLFLKALPDMASGFDAIWIILAVVTAWRIPKALGLRVIR